MGNRKRLSFKAKVRIKRVHKVEEYMSKVSKEDKDFLHLLTHLKVKNTGENMWTNIIQHMEARYSTPMGDVGTMPSSRDAMAQDAVPSTLDTTQGRETSGGNSISSTAASTVPCRDEATPGGVDNYTMPGQEGAMPNQGGTMPSGENVMAQCGPESPQPGEAVLNSQVRLEALKCDFPEFQE